MKNDFIKWGLMGGMFVAGCFISWPVHFFWLYYVFFCLMGVFLLLIGKRSGHLTRMGIVTTIFVCLIGCVLLYLLRIVLHLPAF